MKKFAFIIYRSWAYEIFKNTYAYQQVRQDFVLDTLITPATPEFSYDRKQFPLHYFQVDEKNHHELYTILQKQDISVACFFGWSYLVKNPLISDFLCLGLHPSPLPKYRGGTPLQHQILAGEEDTRLTLFQMHEGVDDGPIFASASLSLLGDIENIFHRLADVGSVLTKQFIDEYVTEKAVFTPQKNMHKFPPFKRRKPSDSEIVISAIKKMSYQQLYNLVRGLRHPFPNVYVEVGKKKLLIQRIIPSTPPKNAYIVNNPKNDTKKTTLSQSDMFFQLKDGYAKIVEYKIEDQV